MKLRGAKLEVTMDREIVTYDPLTGIGDYIVPGGYEFGFLSGESVRFDFVGYYGVIVDRNKIIFTLNEPDTTEFPDFDTRLGELLSTDTVSEIKEIFIYTGEPGKQTIRTSAVNRFIFYFENDNGEEFVGEIDKALLQEYSRRAFEKHEERKEK